MIITNNKPTFLSVWKSLSKAKKRELINEFTASAEISDLTFFRKKESGNWTAMEQDWWANRLELPKEELFPNI